MKFSEIDPGEFEVRKEEIVKLTPQNENLEKMVREFQNDLTDENRGNLKFIKFVIKSIKNNEIDIPVIPETAGRILALSNDKNSQFSDYAEIVKNDPTITLKIIKLANSSLYRGLRDVSDISLAMSRIGIDGIKEIVLTDSLNSVIFKNETYKKHTHLC